MNQSAAEKTHQRGKELTPARLFAFGLWKENPQITTPELAKALKEKGFEVGKTTSQVWLTRFKKGSTVHTYGGKRPTAVAVKPDKFTIEQIIKAVGSIEALSLLFYQGVMEQMKRRDSAYDVLKQECLEKDELISGLKHELDEVTRERNRIIREFNEKIAKVKIGTLTLDQIERRLIPKK